jgi:hypothetical protein
MELQVPTDSIFDAPANHPRLAEARQSLGGEMGKSSKTFSRRGFMRKGLGIGTALLLSNLPGSIPVGSAAPAHDHEPVDGYEEWKDFKPGAAFVEPEVRRSANGALNTTLRMQ